MSNSTETYWAVDGVSLQTYAFNIETLGGDRLAPPPLRGDDLTIPYAPGQRWMPKVVDARTITLGMWVIGANEDGSIPTDQSVRRQFDENWRKLRNLLWTPGRQVELTKRFWVDGELKTATALAQFDGGLNPRMSGPARAAFTVDLRLSDPYFYGPEITETLTTETLNVEGDDITRRILLNVVGSRTNVKIRNATLGIEVEYHASLNSGAQVNIDVLNFTSTTVPSGGDPFNSIGNIRQSGDAFWMALAPGSNSMQVTSDSGIGAVTMKYREAWL